MTRTFNPLAEFPEEWKTTATRIPRSGRGPDGNFEEPSAPEEVEGFLIAPIETSESTDFSSVSTNRANGYADRSYEFAADDVIVTLPGSVLPGRWQVDGDPVRWPFGWHLNLKTVRRS